jgi:hypothetical protein
MKEYSASASDLKTLIGPPAFQGHIHQQQEQELSEACLEVEEPLPACYFCTKPIEPSQPINLHHPKYKSNGGIKVEPAHESCHVEYHSMQGDFKEWGKQSALTRAWSWNLKNVRTHPAYDFDRQYYLALYAH